MVQVGQTVDIEVEIENTGNVTHTFFIGCTIRDATGNIFDLPAQRERESPGSRGAETFHWRVPSSAAKGNADVIAGVWENEPAEGVQVFDRETRNNAFNIS